MNRPLPTPTAMLLALWLAGGAAALERPDDLAGALVIAEQPLRAAAAPTFDHAPDGAGLRVRIEPGETVQWTLADGSLRFASAGAGEHPTEGAPLLPVRTRMLEVPPTGALRLVVEELRSRPLSGRAALAELDEKGELSGTRPWDAAQDAAPVETGSDWAVRLGDPVIFRDLRLVPLSFHPVYQAVDGLRLVESVVVRLETGAAAEAPLVGALAGAGVPPLTVRGNELQGPSHAWSENMESVYAGMVENHGQFYDRVDESVFPVYLIVGSPTYLTNPVPPMVDFVRWKRDKGFDVRVVPFDQMEGGGETISFGSLRNWIRQQWTELRPEYLLLVGDEDGAAACPDSVVQSNRGEFNVSDHFYSLQEGADYFPELFVGRFSVDNRQQLNVMALKPVIYEKSPNVAGDGWLTHGLVVSGNYTDNGDPPVTPNLTSRWVIDKLRVNGFTMLPGDSIFYPPVSIGGPSINSALNAGRGIVSYRGWANATGWSYPEYKKNDIDLLGNVIKMPIVASFVCQTGAYGGEVNGVPIEDPCFGEHFVRVGDPGAPKGAVAFVGPSDLHTRSQYNNPVCSGFFNAIFDLDRTTIGAALLNGKMELWRGYPNEQSDPYGAYFYFHIYNVLGDANLNIWRHEPGEFALQAPTALSVGQSAFEVFLGDGNGGGVDGALVTLTGGADGSALLARVRASDGHALLQFDAAAAEAAGNLRLTANHIDYLPAQRDYVLGAAERLLEVQSLPIGEETVDGRYRAGETLQLTPVFFNAGTGALPAGTVSLRDPLDWPGELAGYEVLSASATLPALAAGASAAVQQALTVRVDGDVAHGQTLPFVFEAVAGDYQDLFVRRIDVAGLNLELLGSSYASGAGSLGGQVVDTLRLSLRNANEIELQGVDLHLSSDDERVLVLDGEARIEAVLPDEDVQAQFVVLGATSLFDGMAIDLRLEAVFGAETAVLTVSLPTGELTPDDPWGPDAWGYVAIDSEDYDVSNRPAYDWVELDPAYGGTGATWLPLRDDDVTTIESPFPITLYGRTSNTLSVCSNGWVSLGRTWQANFRNWNLPSSLGPPSLIAPYWDDLKPKYTPAGDSVHVPVFWRHDAAQGRVVISWSRTYNRYAWENAGQPLQEFQVVFYDQTVRPTASGDTDILFQYKNAVDIDQNNNFATCGIENFGHNVGLQLNYASHPSPGCRPFGAGRAVLLTTQPALLDGEIRVDVLEPQAQQWVRERQPTIRWNHGIFALLTGAAEFSYHCVLRDAAGAPIAEATVDGAGAWDLAAAGVTLPETAGLRLTLTALADGVEYASRQGEILFNVDATPPALTTALLENGLFPHHVELGVFASETLGSLSAEALDADGGALGGLEQDAGVTLLDGGRELRFLRAQLDERLATLRIAAVDQHGLEARTDLPVAAAGPGGPAALAIPGAELATSGAGAGWTVLVGLKDDGDERAFDSGLTRFDLRLPTGAGRARLTVAAGEGVLVRLGDDGAEFVEQTRVDGVIHAVVGSSGVYALASDEAAPGPASFALLPVAPNPFNPDTWIAFDLPAQGPAALEIYNVAGQLVRTLHAGPLPAGRHRLRWDGLGDMGEGAASGLYIARLEWNGRQRTAKMLLVR